MVRKSVYLLFFFVSAIAIANAAPAEQTALLNVERSSSGQHDLILGSRTPTDKLLFKSTSSAEPSESSETSDPSGYVQIISTLRTFDEKTKITQVRALDQMPFGNGGFATLLSGGPGTNEVTLQLRSQSPRHGVNFVIEVYGE